MTRSWGWVVAAFGVAGCFVGGSDLASKDVAKDGGAKPHDSGLLGFDMAAPDAAMPTQPTTLAPHFGATVIASTPPPPISGGTLLVTKNGLYAIAADPDRDRIYGVDLAAGVMTFTTALTEGDEPGRIAEDGSGRVHVALRHGGALVTIDEASGAVLARRSVCPAPRGVTWDDASDLVWVACATGELVAFPSAGGDATKRFVVERDLRDVVVQNGALSVSSFRSAEILRLGSDASITRRDRMPIGILSSMTPHVAWRTVAGPLGSLLVVHQIESTSELSTQSTGGYGGGCNNEGPPPPDSPLDTDGGAPACASDKGQDFANVPCEEMPGAVTSELTILASDGTKISSRVFPGTLPVDVAISRDGLHIATVAAGDGFATKLGSVSQFSSCGDLLFAPAPVGNAETPIAVAFDASNRVIVQTREPAKLWIDGAPITLSTLTRDDTGHDIFHAQAGVMIACASCHPEGGDDGHVWNLEGNSRRTPSLRGTIAGTAPYHWPGDQASFSTLVDDVYSHRMAGASLASDQKDALSQWVEKIPAPPMPSWLDLVAAWRGRAIFFDANVGCASCHSGDKLTNNQTVDVNTGGAFQVPPLVGVGWRTPLMHDGCATTLLDRFGKCATPHHGEIGALTSANVSDLATYLESL